VAQKQEHTLKSFAYYKAYFTYLSGRMKKSLNAILQKSTRTQRHSNSIQGRHDSLKKIIT